MNLLEVFECAANATDCPRQLVDNVSVLHVRNSAGNLAELFLDILGIIELGEPEVSCPSVISEWTLAV